MSRAAVWMHARHHVESCATSVGTEIRTACSTSACGCWFPCYKEKSFNIHYHKLNKNTDGKISQYINHFISSIEQKLDRQLSLRVNDAVGMPCLHTPSPVLFGFSLRASILSLERYTVLFDP